LSFFFLSTGFESAGASDLRPSTAGHDILVMRPFHSGIDKVDGQSFLLFNQKEQMVGGMNAKEGTTQIYGRREGK
jgi:hypothetical protein